MQGSTRLVRRTRINSYHMKQCKTQYAKWIVVLGCNAVFSLMLSYANRCATSKLPNGHKDATSILREGYIMQYAVLLAGQYARTDSLREHACYKQHSLRV